MMKRVFFVFMVVVGMMFCIDSKFTPFSLSLVFAHCDTVDGPVVKTAKVALDKGDVTPVLKWVKIDAEKEIKDLFQKTLIVRSKGQEAKDLADMYFFETLVRIHRAGEGAPYTGLKPADAVEPAILEADKALESGSVDNLVKLVTDTSTKGIRDRFNKAYEAKKHADHNVEAGREFVEAYVQFTHYVERLHMDAASSLEHKHEGHKGTQKEDTHKH